MLSRMVYELKLDINQKELLKRILEDYEWKEKSYNIDVWKNYLVNFINTKSIEGKSKTTLIQYDFEIKKLMEYLNVSVDDVTSDMILDYLANYKAERNISNRTLENKRLIYSSFFSWLHNKGLIKLNPVLSLGRFKIEKKVRKPFSDEERHKLLDACKSVREKALLELLYSSCMRVGEITSIKVEQVNFEKQEIVVFGKGSKERVVYFSDIAKMYLLEYLKIRDVEHEYLFLNSRKEANQLQKEGVKRILHKVGKKAGIDNVHAHRFRRTGATNALRRGMPLQEVSIMLGHEKLETTMIYCDIDQQTVKHNHKKYLSY